MILSDLPPREQERYLDGITVGIGTREHGRPRSDRERLDPFQGEEEGWLWRRGFDVGFDGRDAAEDLATLTPLREAITGHPRVGRGRCCRGR
jgi:hypothetical protein